MMRAVISTDGNDSKRMPNNKRDTDFSVKCIMSSQQVWTSHVCANSTVIPSSYKSRTSDNRGNQTTTFLFTAKDLQQFFFGKARTTRQSMNGTQRNTNDDLPRKHGLQKMNEMGCGVCQQESCDTCMTMRGPLQSLSKLVKAQHYQPDDKKDKMELTYAVTSCPAEVQLCKSSVPSHCYGVSARQFIPIGTWIGPYEGIRLNTSELKHDTDTSYMWEIYQDGQITSYLDGSDENVSSWMRFIRCARHKLEQNLFSFQYSNDIYYRAFKDIPPETELLVWYDNDHYDKFLGIPIGLRDATTSTGHLYPQEYDHTVSTFNPSYPMSSHLPPSLMQHCDILQTPIATTENDCTQPPVIESLAELTKVTGINNETTESNGRSSESPNSEQLESGIWRCGQCFKSFTQRCLLQIHVCPHLPEKPYQCGHCAQCFSHPTDLRTHVVTHNSERPFKCGFCGRSFAGSTTLNNHIRTHTGEKPFVCEKCGRPFSQASQLSRHQRIPEDCHGNNIY